MRRDETASKCFVQLVGNRKLASDKALELPSLHVSELMSFQNHAGLRGWTRTGRPCPAFHGMRKSSTCGFDFTDYGMLGGSRPGPVNRHGFEIAGSAGARLAPIMGPAPAGWSLGGWRPVGWKRKPASGGTRDALGAPRGPDPASRVPCPRVRAALSSQRRPRLRKVFPKLSLHRRPSSRIVLLRTGA